MSERISTTVAAVHHRNEAVFGLELVDVAVGADSVLAEMDQGILKIVSDVLDIADVSGTTSTFELC